MVRGPRRVGAPREGQRPADSRRLQRKMEKALEQSHGGYAGESIIEMLESALTEACTQYRVIRDAIEEASETEEYSLPEWVDVERRRGLRKGEARGRIRGLAISIAMMRHPYKKYSVPWWNYVKKLEKRHMKKAAELMDN